LQIVSRIRADILSGVYKADEQIPPVRQLAFEAGVNPNTMQRAFAVLEEEQLFVTRGTVGRFITTDTAVLERAREALRRETVARLLEEAKAVGLEPDQLIEAIRNRLQEQAAPQDTQDTDTKGVNSL
jgi:DNA-binding transcriptional regulator YhcF (GntR family)